MVGGVVELLLLLVALEAVLVFKEPILILLKLLLGSNSSSAIAPEVASVIQIDVKVVHAGGATVTVDPSCVDIDV